MNRPPLESGRLTHAYPWREQGRISQEEIAGVFRERYGLELVQGLAEIVDLGGAAAGEGRVAGHMEVHTLQEWVLPLCASKGITWRTAPPSTTNCGRYGIIWAMGLGNGSPMPQPSGQWDLYCNDRYALSIRVVNHDQIWRGDACSLTFSAHRIETAPPYCGMTLSGLIRDESRAAFGPAILSVPADWVEPGVPAVLRLEPRGSAATTRWVQLAMSPGVIVHSDLSRVMDMLDPARCPCSGGYNVYFGDIHTHSGQVRDDVNNKGCGMGSWRDNYTYAKGPGGLDFYALTDHEFQVDPANQSPYFELAEEWNQPGRFAVLPAFEHTSLVYGHRNVYFRGPGGCVVNANRLGGTPTWDMANSVPPPELWRTLEEKARAPFITVPHHPSSASHPLTWDFHDPRYDRLVEVYSVWGSSEYYGDFPKGVTDRYRALDVRDALARGYRLGLIASADGHDGHPGDAQSPLNKHHHQFHFLGSGRAAVLANELTREAVFDALHARRCYATTGTPILLDFSVSGHIMGTEAPPLPPGERPRIRVACAGTNGLDHVRIIKNGHVSHTHPCHGEWACEVEWEDKDAAPGQVNTYYARVVQVDRESAWSSPVWM